MALTNHKCTLGLDSDNLLQKGPLLSRACNYLRSFILISFDHPNTLDHFRSYSAVLAEQQRQTLEIGSYMIHPLSLFSLGWNTIIAIAMMVHMVCTTLRLGYILESSRPRLHALDEVILALHVACLLDIIIKFNTGYQESFPSNFVMNRQSVACGWFFFDLVSSLPISYALLSAELACTRCLLLAHALPIVKIARLNTSLDNTETFIKVFTRSYIWHRAIRHVLLLAITLHWSNCIVYGSPVLSYYWNGQMPKDYHAFFLNSTVGDLTKISLSLRYQKALYLCISSLYGSGISMYRVYNPDEYIVHSIVILYTSMFMIYTTVFLLNTYMTVYNSVIRYHGLMNQVETYMTRKQFPTGLKKRVRTFYDYKYWEQYYKDDTALDYLSDQLRHEIVLHTCHRFVNKVKLFEGLSPDVVGVILSHFQPEVFLANDLVVRAGDMGSCMYFVANGTVAVYSLKGAEVRHLQDGDHFGAIALMMKDNKRVATVVAIEISHLYRLDNVHFRKYIMSNPILRERMEVLASKRMHETVVVDEAFRRQQKRKQEHRNFGTSADKSKDSLRSQ